MITNAKWKGGAISLLTTFPALSKVTLYSTKKMFIIFTFATMIPLISIAARA